MNFGIVADGMAGLCMVDFGIYLTVKTTAFTDIAAKDPQEGRCGDFLIRLRNITMKKLWKKLFGKFKQKMYYSDIILRKILHTKIKTICIHF